MRLLLIEDDAALRTSLVRAFERQGAAVRTCADGLQALAAWQEHAPEVVILDLSLPGRDGLEVLSQARRAGLATPVIILTARGTVGDRVIGLNTGADDYLPKPFDLDELEARVRALHRRHAQADGAENGTDGSPHWGRLRLDRGTGAIYDGHAVLEFTPRELRLMHALMARPGQAVTREHLHAAVFPGAGDVQHEAIEVVVYRLRRKLADTGAELVTLRGLGYLLKSGS